MRGERLVDVWVQGVPRQSASVDFARALQDAMASPTRDQIVAPNTVSVKIEFYMPNVLSCDIDNLCAVILNALYQVSERENWDANIIYDDNLVANLEATKIPAAEEKTHIQLWKWKGP